MMHTGAGIFFIVSAIILFLLYQFLKNDSKSKQEEISMNYSGNQCD